MNNGFKTVIGLEIHIQLNTVSKMFCGCDNNAQGKAVNELSCPICMGMPGTLPVANKEAIRKAIKIGLALDCEIAPFAKFDRKHYFYPDLPKGYQISQYDKPFCVGGKLEIGGKQVRLNRIHLEEDAGKLVHPKGADYSIVDLNRAGTPLVEIVTEPDIDEPSEASEFLKELQLIARSVDISSADMEKGHLRCDANINVIKGDKSSPIVEIKNLNSFKFVQKALEYEKERLIENFDSFDGKKTKQTRGFNSSAGKTYSLREKEAAKDYRYFPEPDIPPVLIGHDSGFDLNEIKAELTKLPTKRKRDLCANGVDAKDALIIVKDSQLNQKVEEVEKISPEKIKSTVKILINEKGARNLETDNLVKLLELIEKEKLSSNIVRQIIAQMTEGNLSLDDAVKNISNGSDGLEEIIDKILAENKDAAEKYKAGKKEVLGFLLGAVMRETRGQANPAAIREFLEKKLI